MTGDENNPHVHGLQGILNTYKDCVKKVKLSAPTNFSPVLRNVMATATGNKEAKSKEYTILLILTDG